MAGGRHDVTCEGDDEEGGREPKVQRQGGNAKEDNEEGGNAKEDVKEGT